MATIVTNFQPDPERFAFTSLPQTFLEQSSQPRAEVVFNVVQETVTAGGVGDDQQVVFLMAPPLNFAYVLVDLFCEIAAADEADAANWEPTAVATIITGDGLGNLVERAVMQGWSIGNVGPVRPYQFDKLPRRLFMPAPGTLNLSSLVLRNVVNNGAAATSTMFARFLQYDISQKHHYQVNSPIPTR